MTIQETKTQAGYFRGNPKYGRTTQLIEKATGRVLFEGMGAGWTRKELHAAYLKQVDTAERLAEDFARAAAGD